MPQFDVLIFGSGLAGLSAALSMPDHLRVALLSKGPLGFGASQWAQGGIAGVLGADDCLEDHVADTLVAGAGGCDEAATRHILARAPDAIRWLQTMGVSFTLDGADLHLTREGGHGRRRVAHVDDATGAAVQAVLCQALRGRPNVQVLQHHALVDLLCVGVGPDKRCVGASVLEVAGGAFSHWYAPQVVLATGGLGQVFAHTTNPHVATGDGLAAAWRAGCEVADLEYVQFHPTALCHPQADSFLISEAVRGEGGLLLLPNGERFMPRHDRRAELAPRDVVARAIHSEMVRGGLDCVYLDIAHKGRTFVAQHFPNILRKCASIGLDITREPIPVVPAAHYACGGVVADCEGRTTLPGLRVIGETACTGLHGANRLASNSLVECIVTGQAAAAALSDEVAEPTTDDDVPPVARVPNGAAVNAGRLHAMRQTLRHCMSAEVGMVRHHAGLQRALATLADLQRQLPGGPGAPDSLAHLELRNLLTVGGLIAAGALRRRESRGAHHLESTAAAGAGGTA